jgi:uncharacterized protein YyaL (SSP411 family)
MDSGIPGDVFHTGTYSHPEVAELINDRFIPIKVDNDRRPDINARYNMGGWPTTAFLTPTGEPLYGETYVTPDRMLVLLKHISDYYNEHKDEIVPRLVESEDAAGEALSGPITSDILATVRDAIEEAFDPVYGGFGSQPKFPHTDALAFALRICDREGEEALGAVVMRTLDAMAGGGMYDAYAGGFFRYSTTRDWSVPHFEKMLEDNALLSQVYLRAAHVLHDSGYADIAKEVHGWMFDVMFDPESGTFAGSQDADKEEAYYGLPLAERAEFPTPFIDRTAYANWNALAVSSLVERYRLFQEGSILASAVRTYDFIKAKVWPHHFYAEGRARGERYLIGDVNPMLAAALDLAETASDSAPYLEDAREFASVLLERLQDVKHGGFVDLKPEPGALGALSHPKKEIGADSAAALSLLRLDAFTGESRYRQAAEAALRPYADDCRKYLLFAASYATAVAQLLAPVVHVVIVGEPSEAAAELRKAVWECAIPGAAVESRPSSRAGEYAADPSGRILAYACIGTACTIAAGPDELKRCLESRLRPSA